MGQAPHARGPRVARAARVAGAPPPAPASPNSILKIRIYPTKVQRKLLNNAFSTHRTLYNQLVERATDCFELSHHDLQARYGWMASRERLREAQVLDECHMVTPAEVLNSTLRDFFKSVKAAKASYVALVERATVTNTAPPGRPRMHFKSKKHDSFTSIELRARDTHVLDGTRIRFFPRYFGRDGFATKMDMDLPDIRFAVRLQRTREDRFYLCLPRVRVFPQTTSRRACAIDPGVRSFATIYDPSGLTVRVNDQNSYIFRQCLWIEELQSELATEPSKRRRHRLRKRINNCHRRVTNTVNDMHNKLSKWLSTNYHQVLLPKFETSVMTLQQNRLSTMTTRKMLTMAHYTFKQMLTFKMERTGGRLIECTTEYMTKACSRCGRLNRRIVADRVFRCRNQQCRLVMDRDVNAARNIFLMNERMLE